MTFKEMTVLLEYFSDIVTTIYIYILLEYLD